MALKQSLSVGSLAELANYNSSNGEVIFVNDKVRTSGNPFRWAGSGLKANGGTVQPGSGGVWEMMFDGPVNVNWFGALPNGSDVTIAFQNAVDYAHSIGRSVYVPGNVEPNFYYLGQINLHDNSTVYGDYRRSIIVPASARVKSIFNIQGGGFSSPSTFNNLYRLTIVNQVHAGPITTGCTGINAKFCDELHLNEIIIDGFDINLNLENSNSVFCSKLRLRSGGRNNMRVTFLKPNEPPFVGTWINLTECEFNGGILAHAPAEEKFSVYVDNIASITFDRCVVTGNMGGGIKFKQSYVKPAVAKDMGFVVITGCDIDSNHGIGIRGEFCRNCIIKGNWISSGREQKVSGIDLLSCESSVITENQCFLNGDNGINLSSCRFMTVTNNICQNNGSTNATSSSSGIKSSNSNNNIFSGNICNTEQYGWSGKKQTVGITSDVRSQNNILNSNIATPPLNAP